ncbi:hypothetical protein pah_c010o026 [Parachlamydia acanthamoebae str. Hall's coccus]|nr:hypothetical protein pah_c010o026 [Parachlamydia acanthamoebae str. Hall's coccus]
MPFTDLTLNQFVGGMSKIFDLEPFIKLHSLVPVVGKIETEECVAAF